MVCRPTIKSLVVVFIAMNYELVVLGVFTNGKSVNDIDRNPAMFNEVVGTFFKCKHQFVGYDENAVLLEAVPVELLDLTAVENELLVSDELSHLQ